MKITKTMSLWNWTLKTKNKNPSLYAGVALSSPIFLPKNRSFIIFVGFQATTISSLVFIRNLWRVQTKSWAIFENHAYFIKNDKEKTIKNPLLREVSGEERT